MNNQIGLGIFGTFGEPHGFQQVFYYGSHFNGSLDLDDAAIEFYPGAPLYAVRREIVDGVHYICIAIYSYVRELNTERMGTFVGSCMVLQDGFTEADYIYKVLSSLHEDLLTNEHNIRDGVINVAQGADIIIREPAEFVAVQANVIPLNKTPFFSSWVDEGKKCLVVPSPLVFGNQEAEVIDFIDEALKHYSDTGTLYFSFDKNVYEFVSRAGLLSVVEWDEFKERKSKMQQKLAVRTKKGIKKASVNSQVPSVGANISSVDSSISAPQPQDEPQEPHAYASAEYEDDDSEYEHDSQEAEDEIEEDPLKPFDEWEEPPTLWTNAEVKYRVREYNRLFRYTNSLLGHINEPEQPARSNRRKKRFLLLALLLLIISGSVAIYFLGFYNSSEGLRQASSAESPRAIQQSEDSAVAAALSGSTGNSALMSASVADAQSNSMSNESLPYDAEEDEYEEYDEDKAGPTSAATSSRALPAPGTVAAFTDAGNGTGSVRPSSQMPQGVTTPQAGAAVGSHEDESMPEIYLPAAPPSNLPAGATYVSNVNKEQSAGTNTSNKVAPGGVATAAPFKASGQGSIPASIAAVADKQTQPYAAPGGNIPGVAGKTAAAPGGANTNTQVSSQPIGATSPASGAAPAPTAKVSTAAGSAIIALPASAGTHAVVAAGSGTVSPANSLLSAKPAPATTTAVSTNSVSTTQMIALTTSLSATNARPVSVRESEREAAAAAKAAAQKPAAATTSKNSMVALSASRPSEKPEVPGYQNVRTVDVPSLVMRKRNEQLKLKNLYPRPNGQISQRDIPILSKNGIKNKTLTELTRLIMEHAPESVGKYYVGQELQYAAALLNGNRQAFERRGNDYVCTADYLILHIPAIIKPTRPVAFPK